MKLKEKLLAPEDEYDLFGGSEESSPDDSGTDTVVDDGGGNTDTGDGGNGGQSAGQVDPNVIADAIARGFEKIKPQEPAPRQQLTKEELAERMGVWDPSDEEANELSNLLNDPEKTAADKKRALTVLRDKIVNQALKTAEIQFQAKLNEIQQSVAPVLPVIYEQKRRQAEKEFYDEFPKLKAFKEVVVMTARTLGQKLQSGEIAPDPKISEREFLARETFKVIKQVRPDVGDDLIKKQPKGSAPNPAATTTTGKGGGGAGSQTKSSGKAASIWD